MQKHLLYINLFTLTSALALGACADKGGVEDIVTPPTPDPEPKPEVVKTPIELTATSRQDLGERPLTRAVVIDGEGKITAFEKDTRLHMLLVSQDGSTLGRADTYAVTYGLAKGSGTAPSNLNADPTKWTDTQKASAISFNDENNCSQTYEDPANELTGSKTVTDTKAFEGSWRYWDDAYARDAQISVYGVCVANTILPSGAPWNQKINKIASNGANQWYTGDIDYKIGAEQSNGSLMKWTIGMHPSYSSQTYISTLYKDDLCYSNNITDDEVLKFSNKSTGKFDKGQLLFRRAMSLITIKLYWGSGFDNTNFLFDTGKNIAMKGFNKQGYLNIKTGEWSDIATGNWSSICNTDPTPVNEAGKPAYTLLAFVIPGDDLNESSVSDALTISIAGNDYKLSKKYLLDALAGNAANCDDGGVKTTILTDRTKLKAGINYEFSFTIGKKAIESVSAQIVDWETVSAINTTPSNARIELMLEERGDGLKSTDKFSLYRASDNNTGAINDEFASYNWTKGYNEEGLTPSYVTDHWSTNWFWDNNKNFYHFRALCEAHDGTTTPKSTVPSIVQATDDIDYDYLSLEHGETYKDICWGAPMLDDKKDNVPGSFKWNYGPTLNGFDGLDNIDFTKSENKDKHQIYKAIGPTEEQIKLIMFHMMSEVTIIVKTEAGDAGVSLGNGTVGNCTTLEFKNIATTGKLLMGNGLVMANTPVASYPFEAHPAPDASVITWSKYGAIPQALDDVVLVITTPDENKYEINMMNLIAATTGGTAVTSNNIVNPYLETEANSGKYKIDRWYPNFKYTYTFTLKKKGVYDLAVTILDWENVIAGDDNVQIK